MPQRSFRIVLSNNTDFDLVRTAHVLCPALGGDPIWTSSEWEPPLKISAQSERAWQSESSGVAVGVSGFVKYRIAIPPEVIPGGTPPPPTLADEIYIYWVNPFEADPFNAGVPPTKAKCAIDTRQVGLDCDEDGQPSSNSGAFADPQSQFEIVPEWLYDNKHPDWTAGAPLDGSTVGNPVTVMVGAYYWPAGFLLFLNDVAIEPHAWAQFTVRERGSVRQAFSLTYNPAHGIRPVIGNGPARLRSAFRMRGG